MKGQLFLLSLIVLCSGCAMTMDCMNISYSSPLPQDGVCVLDANLVIGEIDDKRGLEDPSIIIHKINLHGQTTSGGYQAPEPLADIVKKALEDYFSNYKIRPDIDKNYELFGSIMDFKYKSISGWVSVTLKPEMIMKFYLRDLSTSKVVWNETIFGRGVVKDFNGSEDAINKMLQAALDDVLNQLSRSETLFDFL